jgi:hypothetical protein
VTVSSRDKTIRSELFANYYLVSSSLLNVANNVQATDGPLTFGSPDILLSSFVSSWSLSSQSQDIEEIPSTPGHSPRSSSQIRLASLAYISNAQSPSTSCPQITLPIGKEEEDDVDMFFQRGGDLPFLDNDWFLSPPLDHDLFLVARSHQPVSSRRSSTGSGHRIRQTTGFLQSSGPRSAIYSDSSFSATSNVFNVSSPLSPIDQAVFDPLPISQIESGKIQAGTLEGLVEFSLCQHSSGQRSGEDFFDRVSLVMTLALLSTPSRS